MDFLPLYHPRDAAASRCLRLWRLGTFAARANPRYEGDGVVLSEALSMAVVYDERAGNVLVTWNGEVVFRGRKTAVEVYRPGGWETVLETMARLRLILYTLHVEQVLTTEAAMRTYQQLCPRCGALCTVEVHHHVHGASAARNPRNGRARRETTCHRCRHRRGGRFWRVIVTLAVLALWGYAAYLYTELWLSGAW